MTVSAKTSRRRVRRARRAVSVLVLLSPFAALFLGDLVHRASLMARFDTPHAWGYVASSAESAVFWGVLLYAASRRRSVVGALFAALFVVLYTLAAGVESAFHALYNIYLSIDGQIHSKSIPWSIVGALPLSRPATVAHLAGFFLFAVGLVALARHFVRPGRVGRAVGPAFVPFALVAVTQIPVSYRAIQSTPPDLIYFHGLTGLAKERLGITHDAPDLRVQLRDPMPVPPLVRSPKRPRNVLFLLQESQRYDVTCNAYDPNCELATRSSNAALPERMPLSQLRANDSTTAISISNIWSGLRPTEGRKLLHAVPLLWDYAHAAGYDTAYWTSQNLIFGNSRLYVQDIPVSHRCTATDLDPLADLDAGAHDAMVADRVIEEWGEMKEPFFAVVHFSNAHFPYIVDDEHAPFQPASLEKSAEKNEEYKNTYKNAVYLSDLAVGKLIRHVRASETGPRTVIVYTADHGESFREHWQLGHTSSIYDEEVRVPGWVDAPEGTLAPEERESIVRAESQPLWHLDLGPTFLDLLGLWDEPNMAPFRARMMGHPITRPERTVGPVPMTNCTWVWECAFRNWGMMMGPLKLEAREWDGEYHCFNVLDDPDEIDNLGERGCGPLASIARETFHVMPNVTPPGRREVDWGKRK